MTELRLVVTATDYEVAVHFFRDVLGLPEQESYRPTADTSSSSTPAGPRWRSTIRPTPNTSTTWRWDTESRA
jgi:hypothetical protein